jgi:hypothetical protein
VLVGNALYFLVLVRRIPAAARHQPFKLDLGLLVDTWVCLVVYGLVELLCYLRHRNHRVSTVR